MNFTNKQINEFWSELSQNLYYNMLTTMAYALHEAFGFGKTRLQKVKAAFDKYAVNAISLDWMGEHYVKLEDYAIELNEKYDLGLDVVRVAACQDAQEKSTDHTGWCKMNRVLEELKAAGYKDAAVFLEKKMK